MTVERHKLYEEVWAEPMITVAARYGVSSSFLARVCTRMRVPRPERGYWAKLAVGKAPAKPVLPDAQAGDELEWSRSGEPRRVKRALPQPPSESLRIRKRAKAARPSRHPLLVHAPEHFRAAHELDSGYLRPSKRLLVDVFVSNATLDRALDLGNELFLAFDDRSHLVTYAPADGTYQRPSVDERIDGGQDRGYNPTWRPSRPTVVFIGTVVIGLTVFELSDAVEVRYLNGKYVRISESPMAGRRSIVRSDVWVHKRDMPSGKLCIRASSPYPRAAWEKQWRETSPGELTRKIPQIVRELEAEAGPIAKLVEEGERQAEIERQEWEKEQRRWQREDAERRRKENIKRSRDQLLTIVESWSLARRIDAFFEDAERRTSELAPNEQKALADRLRQARDLLGGVDALEHFRNWQSPEDR